MKKVLIISYYWPPSGGSGVQRWLKFTKYLPQYGWEPVIYTPDNPEANAIDTALLKDIKEGTTVIKRKIWEPYGFYKALFGKTKKTEGNSKPSAAQQQIRANLISSENKSLTHRISLFIRGNFFIPDPRCFWIKPSVKFLAKYLKDNPVDAIVSTGPPHSMHLIAKQLAKKTGVKWIADFRDPWTEIFYFKHLKLSKYAYDKHRKLEQEVLDNADKIIVVSRQMQEDFAKRTSTPVEIITNGFDPDDFKHTSLKQPNLQQNNNTKFTLTHTGIFVDNGNPSYLWEVLGEKAAKEPEFKSALEIRLMGQVDSLVLEGINRAELSGNLINMGYVSHDIVTSWQQKASVLLLPLRKEPEAAAILTGKFFEYLAAGAPILAFGPANGDLAKALQDTASGIIVDFEDKEGVKKGIDSLYAQFLAEKDNLKNYSKKINDKANKYSRVNLTGELTKLLNSL